MTESNQPGQEPQRQGVPPPYPLAMIICDAIWRDPWTGKRTLIGLFSVIHAREFPAVHPFISIHACCTDGRGKVTLTVRIVDVDEEHPPLLESSGDVEFTDPRMIAEYDVAHAGGIVFPTPGEYRVQLLANGELIMERRIVVNHLPAEESP